MSHPASPPPPPPRQSRKGSAVQDFDCCPVLHFALVGEKEMSFFSQFYSYSYKCSSPAASPVLREAVTRVGQQGRCPPFAPLPPRSAPDRFLGKSFQLGHSPCWHRRFQGLWSQHRQRAASGTRGQDLPGNRSSYAVAGNQETQCKPAAPPQSGLFQESCRTVTMASCQACSGLLMEAAPSWAICKLIISTS